ncbi:hypothetical protein SKAU_G00046360 [Synaphobranchus kaupii]|uniref:Uncharacterized protein n=1 Tax=Synaphobranchus kaupii TaxID=118154 RepID=A0A9Q1J885_SYNKA|nr:hypothetical protein SKAU_G00046360 [Synaphobranchus kaupii]
MAAVRNRAEQDVNGKKRGGASLPSLRMGTSQNRDACAALTASNSEPRAKLGAPHVSVMTACQIGDPLNPLKSKYNYGPDLT